MRLVAILSCAFVAALGCRPVPQAAVEGRSASHDAGKIPITTRSAQARALYLRARSLNENLQPHEAHALFQQAVALDPSFAFGEYGLATTAPTAKAIARHLTKALELAASASPGEQMMILAFQARSSSDPERTRQIAESLVVLHPQDERAHWTLANAFSAQRQYERAIAELRQAIAINPKYSLAYNQLGYAYRSAGRMDAAEMAFRQYIALVPNDPNPYDSYAELLMKLGRFDESIAQYRRALAIDEHFTGSFVGIAANQMLAGRHDASVAESERYLSVARDDRERRAALLTLAMTYVDQGDTEKALLVMERRMAIASATGDTVNMSADGLMTADILLEAGRADAAAGRYAEAHRLLAASSASDDAKRDDALGARHDAARVALKNGALPVARIEAHAYATGARARRNDARLRQAHELHGLIALADGRYDESLGELALADQQNPAVLYAMSRAHAGRGDRARAAALADQARDLNELPTFPYVFTRASLAAATRSATSGSAGERPR